MTALSPVDFPDWNPPRDRVTIRDSGVFDPTVPDGQAGSIIVPPDGVDNVVLITGFLEPGTALVVASRLLDGEDPSPRQIVNLASVDFAVALPVAHRGNGLIVEGHNDSGATVDFAFTLDSVAGATVDNVIPANATYVFDGLTVPTMAAGSPIDVPQAAIYDRCVVSAQCDQPYTVTVRRAMSLKDPPYTIVTFDELVATSAMSASVTVDVPVGAAGFAVILSGTGLSDGTASVLARSYRAAGF